MVNISKEITVCYIAHFVLFYTANEFRYLQETWRFIKRRSESPLQCDWNLPWQSPFWKSCLHSRKLTSHYYYKITLRKRIFFTKKGEGVNRNVIAMDREKTGTCNFTITAELFWLGHLHFLFPKKSPYSETINRGYKAF